jgi:hypothetical protein
VELSWLNVKIPKKKKKQRKEKRRKNRGEKIRSKNAPERHAERGGGEEGGRINRSAPTWQQFADTQLARREFP